MSFPQYQYFNVSSPEKWVAHVEINRAEKLNAFTESQIRRVFENLSDDAAVRSIVFSGSGDKAFCAGLDVDYAATPGSFFNPDSKDKADAARYAARVRRFAYEFQDCISSIERCEKPVICVLHGISIGLAVDIACCADLRVCTSNVTFAVKEVDIGLAADIGSLTRLPKIVGSYAWVKEVSLTARNFGAQEALRVGFVNSVFQTKAEAISEALRLAKLMASKSPVAVQGTKNFLDWSRDHDIMTGLRYTAVWNGAAVNTTDIPVAMASMRQKKVPTFEKL
ncbi:hypothetical protein B0A52_07738 [Exophiala mesophila]|uniref:Uncharacterized protein n=1 Tax=Exophiala mesophila TaxID=212818 RepID=A0A438MVL5_EXOME|nr:hypothetical protein B0A52_07738 [Exophiala mesophila]